ncbi:threonine-phosphate decarboxylase CobD [Thermodesulfatator atlanticus]|uniref:threonine-phosphate decarboxylase CobD n=1 Tax=Thermodesulfatator atlanticus TaxID=501497 RepID=UPI0003B54284|nr:threonine-phosphate decarboxylase CobD [Thermodesulfatator atlanticus]
MLLGHGGEIYHLARELGIPAEKIADHSSNISPLPPPQGLYSILEQHLTEIEHLPEVDSFSLRNKLAEHFGHDPDEFLPTSGTTEWIFALPRIFSPEKVIVLGPTYSDYADAAKIANIKVEYVLAREEENFEPTIKKLAEKLTKNELVFICNPNNPTGRTIPKEELEQTIKGKEKTIFVIDESYIDFSHTNSLLDSKPLLPNVIILRSFSKIYRIPGLRLGFAAANHKLAKKLWDNMLPWAVNRLAQIAGIWLIEQKEYVRDIKKFVKEEKVRMKDKLKKLPLKTYESDVHFFLIKLTNSSAKEVWYKLLKHYHILIRNASNFYGLKGEFLRFALKTKKENEKLVVALEEILV